MVYNQKINLFWPGAMAELVDAADLKSSVP